VATRTLKLFFKTLIFILLVFTVYSKMLGLPYALAIVTSPSEKAERGSLLLLAPPEGEPVEFECYDALNSACLIGNRPIEAHDEYTIIAVLPWPYTVLLVAVGVVILWAMIRDRFLALVAIAVYVNGAVVGLAYIDQSPVLYEYKPLTGMEKVFDIKTLTITYRVIADIDVVNATCESSGVVLPVETSHSNVTVFLPRDLVLEKVSERKLPAYASPLPVRITIGYNCTINLKGGRILVWDAVALDFNLLLIHVNNNTIKIYNGNPIEFNVSIVIMYKSGGVIKQEVTIEPFSSYTLTVDAGSGIKRVYVEYEYFGKLVRERVWPPR